MTTHRTLIAPADAEPPLFVGVDVGGTNTKIGVLDDLGRTLAFSSIATEQDKGPEDAVARIAAAIRDLLAENGIDADRTVAIGLGTPGTMDIPAGMILEPPNMPGWRYYPIRDRLSEACGKPVAFANDANAAAYGEYWIGSGRGCSSMIMLTLGTGVGGGIIVDGVPIDGTNSFGSECGHIIVDSRDDARYCVWGGGQGELEAYASASALVGRANEELDRGVESSLRARIDAGEELTALMLSQEAESGDDLSLRVILEAARYLGVGVVTLVHTIDPGEVVLGGAMNFGGQQSAVGRKFLDAVRAEFKRRAFNVVADTTTIEFASLGGDAGYIGAAGIAREAHGKRSRA